MKAEKLKKLEQQQSFVKLHNGLEACFYGDCSVIRDPSKDSGDELLRIRGMKPIEGVLAPIAYTKEDLYEDGRLVRRREQQEFTKMTNGLEVCFVADVGCIARDPRKTVGARELCFLPNQRPSVYGEKIVEDGKQITVIRYHGVLIPLQN